MDGDLRHARWLLLYALRCLLVSRLIDAKRKEIEASGFCRWGYRDPDSIKDS